MKRILTILCLFTATALATIDDVTETPNQTSMNHFWIVSLVITKQKAGSIDIGNVVQVHADVGEAEAVGKAVRHVNEYFHDYAIQITEVRLQVVNNS